MEGVFHWAWLHFEQISAIIFGKRDESKGEPDVGRAIVRERNMTMERWKTEKTEVLLDTPWVKVRRDGVRLPNGVKIDDFYAVSIRDASAIVAVDEDGNVILKREYRYCYDRELLEIPAGAFNDGETDPLAVARRELLEETGYVSDSWEYLGPTVESSAKMTNYMHIFLARDCRKVAEQQLDETEDLSVELVPLRQAAELVMSGEICCNSSAHGILRVERMLDNILICRNR